jgi:isopentenyl-diphosphate delta-isomerase
MTKVILVDKKDNQIGVEEKRKAHLKGKLHRAFSIFIFNKKGEILLQKRAKSKYHSAGLWSNTCCSHPGENQNLKEEAKRRLKEEMGIECDLKEIFSFIYKAKVGNLIEHEFDHVFLRKFNGNPRPNKYEVEDWKWINPLKLKKDIKENPERYTYWFKLILEKVLNKKKQLEKFGVVTKSKN